MARIVAGPRQYDVALVIFDKDGTLLDFQLMWARLFQLQMEELKKAIGPHDALFSDLYACMGVDLAKGQIDPLGPLALATYAEIRTIIALTLYRHGWPWDQANRVVAQVTDVSRWPPLAELVKPIGDVAGLFRALVEAGAKIAIVTTDVRTMTQTMLDMIGAAPFVSTMVCADDGLALKPAPDGILAACQQLGIAPEQTMMVGDSPADLLAARAAGVAVRVGVTSGVGRREDLTPWADVVIGSIQELRVAQDNSEAPDA